MRHLLWLFPLLLSAQKQITFTPQPAEVSRAVLGRLIPGTAVLSISICQPNIGTETIFDTQRAYDLAPYNMVPPDMAVAVVNRTIKRNKWGIASRIVGGLSSAVSLLGVGGVISMSDPIIAALVSSAAAFSIRLDKNVPDTTPFTNSLLRGLVRVPQYGCVSGFALSQYRKDMKKEVIITP